MQIATQKYFCINSPEQSPAESLLSAAITINENVEGMCLQAKAGKQNSAQINARRSQKKKGELAGRWGPVVEAFIKKLAWQWRPSRSYARIKTDSFINPILRYRRHPLSGIGIHMLPHSLGRAGMNAGRGEICQMEDTSRQTEAQRKNEQTANDQEER